jgi:deferrochelatase/peroxidase EfeB
MVEVAMSARDDSGKMVGLVASATGSHRTSDVGGPADLADIQGLLRFGFKHHTEALILLLRVKDTAAARDWLGQVQVTSAVTLDPVPPTALQVALTRAGMAALGVGADALGGFSEEFLEGMAGDGNRTRRLGDVGASAPELWAWGSADREPHVAVLLYAMPGHLADLQRTTELACATGFDVIYRLTTTDMGGREPFGFADGLSQPEIDWDRVLAAQDSEQLSYRNLSCLGEFVLGYPNEYGLYTPRPLLSTGLDPHRVLPRAEDDANSADLGRNGSYLVVRQLRQDVRGFWQALHARAGGVDVEREWLASQLVGRTRDGEPIVVDRTSRAMTRPTRVTSTSDSLGERAQSGAVGLAARIADGAATNRISSTTTGTANGRAPAMRDANRGSSPAVSRNATGAETTYAAGRTAAPDLNAFTFDADPAGHRCPIGAHIRRTNPRTADLPPGGDGLVSWLIRTLGFNSVSRARDLAASTRFHRLLRRGREYGTQVTPEQALRLQTPVESGLHFMCLNANIQRQFEFVQSAWIMSTHFNGLHSESDPLLGNRKPGPGGLRCDYFSMPKADGLTRRLENLPQFVTVAGGAYFFLPGIRALRWLACAGPA